PGGAPGAGSTALASGAHGPGVGAATGRWTVAWMILARTTTRSGAARASVRGALRAAATARAWSLRSRDARATAPAHRTIRPRVSAAAGAAVHSSGPVTAGPRAAARTAPRSIWAR